MAHEVHPKKIIESKDGKVVIEKPDMLRTSALSNSIYTYILTDDDLLKLNEMESADERNKYVQIRMLRKGYTTMQLTALAYVTSAPFHLNNYVEEPLLDLKSFLEYADAELITEMNAKIKELGLIDPLQP